MENVRRKKKNGRFVLAVVTAFLLLFASACGQVEGGGAPGADVSGQTVMEGVGSGGSSGPLEDSRGPGGESGSGDEAGEAAKEMTVHFLDVGQGDATLILCGGEAMLIDAGDNGQGTNVQNYLRKQGVEALKYVVCTHPDEDHIGGVGVFFF